MYAVLDSKNTPQLMDVYLAGSSQDVTTWTNTNFDKHYNGNRQPFGIYVHPSMYFIYLFCLFFILLLSLHPKRKRKKNHPPRLTPLTNFSFPVTHTSLLFIFTRNANIFHFFFYLQPFYNTYCYPLCL